MNPVYRITVTISVIQIILIGLLITYLIKRRNSSVVGWLVNLNLICAFLLLFDILSVTRIPALYLTAGVLFAVVAALITLGIIFSFVFLFINAWFVRKREGRGLSSLLVLIAGIAIVLADAFFYFSGGKASRPIQAINFFVLVMLMYLLMTVWNTLMSIVVYNWYFPRKNKDYIIVLGSGLVDGKRVGRLLGNRIDKGVAFYRQQLATTHKHAKLIFSGGKGGDERLPEGVAMQQYAIDKGVPAADTLVEDRSTNTRENLIFSRELIHKDSSRTDNRIVFVSSNFHILRAGILAGKLKFKANGIGAKTPFYYLPTGTIREYLALFVMHKRFHIMMTLMILAISIILNLPGLNH